VLCLHKGGSRLTQNRYKQEAARLARLSRAERFEELIQFPAKHQFKVIGPSEGAFGEAVKEKIVDLGYKGVIPVERTSAKGRYISITFDIRVSSGEQLDKIYTELESLPNLLYLF
jgi:putative lipoic acid-binding regulatory protein